MRKFQLTFMIVGALGVVLFMAAAFLPGFQKTEAPLWPNPLFPEVGNTSPRGVSIERNGTAFVPSRLGNAAIEDATSLTGDPGVETDEFLSFLSTDPRSQSRTSAFFQQLVDIFNLNASQQPLPYVGLVARNFFAPEYLRALVAQQEEFITSGRLAEDKRFDFSNTAEVLAFVRYATELELEQQRLSQPLIRELSSDGQFVFDPFSGVYEYASGPSHLSSETLSQFTADLRNAVSLVTNQFSPGDAWTDRDLFFALYGHNNYLTNLERLEDMWVEEGKLLPTEWRPMDSFENLTWLNQKIIDDLFRAGTLSAGEHTSSITTVTQTLPWLYAIEVEHIRSQFPTKLDWIRAQYERIDQLTRIYRGVAHGATNPIPVAEIPFFRRITELFRMWAREFTLVRSAYAQLPGGGISGGNPDAGSVDPGTGANAGASGAAGGLKFEMVATQAVCYRGVGALLPLGMNFWTCRCTGCCVWAGPYCAVPGCLDISRNAIWDSIYAGGTGICGFD